MPLCPSATNELFSRDLLAELAIQKPTGNLVVSPFSVLVALSVAFAGARGSTFAEYRRRFLSCGIARSLSNDDFALLNLQLDSLNKTLSSLSYSPSLDSDAEPLQFLQRLYIPPDFLMNSEFRRKIAEDLGIELETNGESMGKRNSMDESGLSIVSAAVFRGLWRREFRDAADFGFDAEPKPQKPLPMMFATIPAAECRYIETEEYQSVTIPFADTDSAICPISKSPTHICPTKADQKPTTTITIVLPKVGVKLEALLREGDAEIFSPVDEDDARADIGAVHIALPQFRVSHRTNMVAAADRLALGAAFNPSADLSGIQPSKSSLHFQAFAHSTRVEIGTRGAEEPLPDDTMIVGPLAKFHAQRPFGFAIHAADGTALFAGIIRNPMMGMKGDY